ncbi:general stress protein [Cohnella sp. AR92]|uniref:general stress protein n=1 Tax=Cohnella sp. AR92 TaxID=648716 RepID=UPI000F8F20EA|nr:general stress protein [Cohnella sp. AR92]RUS47801.1 general stress protein [Cohnella sp. AR92]
MQSYTKLVENGLEAFQTVQNLRAQGYEGDDIYVLAHEPDRTERLADAARVNTIGPAEEGVLQTVANFFRNRGDELRGKIEAMGLTKGEALTYEAELDRGKVLVLARK